MTIRLVDAFDLPEWLGTETVTWASGADLAKLAQVEGRLSAPTQQTQQLDILAVDAAYPTPVCPDEQRRLVHQAWQFGEVALVQIGDRLAAAVPGTRLDPDLACEVIRRFAKSVGAPAANFTVSIAL